MLREVVAQCATCSATRVLLVDEGATWAWIDCRECGEAHAVELEWDDDDLEETER